jgi:hypothetical protein
MDDKPKNNEVDPPGHECPNIGPAGPTGAPTSRDIAPQRKRNRDKEYRKRGKK